MAYGHAHAVLAADDDRFRGLSSMERQGLSRWLAAARRAGIDAAEDLGARNWPGVTADCVIGIFESGHLLASWLVVGQGGRWAVARCADGAVSPSFGSLSEALALVRAMETPVMSASGRC